MRPKTYVLLTAFVNARIDGRNPVESSVKLSKLIEQLEKREAALRKIAKGHCRNNLGGELASCLEADRIDAMCCPVCLAAKVVARTEEKQKAKNHGRKTERPQQSAKLGTSGARCYGRAAI